MHGRHLPPDHSKGDANTLGGYMAVHDRPAAFGGTDGYSYSAEILADATGDAVRVTSSRRSSRTAIRRTTPCAPPAR